MDWYSTTVPLTKRLGTAELKMLIFSLGITRNNGTKNGYIRGTATVGHSEGRIREARAIFAECSTVEEY